MKVSTAPKNSFGTYATTEKGARKSSASVAMTTAPQTRERVPVRKVKMVCEKM